MQPIFRLQGVSEGLADGDGSRTSGEGILPQESGGGLVKGIIYTPNGQKN